MSNIPVELKYSNDHEWCRVEGEYAYVGITDFAQSELGDIVFVDVQTEGETLAAGDIFGTIEAVKTVSDAFTPVSGEVVEVNPAIDADPALVNKDPYGEGWMVKIKMSAPEEVEALLKLIAEIKPKQVMVYSLDRDTPCKTLEKVEKEELREIADRVEALGIACSVA